MGPKLWKATVEKLEKKYPDIFKSIEKNDETFVKATSDLVKTQETSLNHLKLNAELRGA